jgi:competence protein ComEC
MYYWNKTPLFRLVFPFILGITTALTFDWHITAMWAIIGCFFTLFIGAVFINKIYSGYTYRIYFGAIINILLFLFGFQITKLSVSKNPNLISGNKLSYFQCTLLEPLKEQQKNFKAIVFIYGIKKGHTWLKKSEKAILYLEKDSLSKKLVYGDCILIYTQLKAIGGPKNPFEFDYKKNCERNGLFLQCHIKKKAWKILPFHKGIYLKNQALKFRGELFNILKKHLPEKNEYSVAQALIAGNTDDLDKDLLSAYSSAGVIHVLSVSGLHIGLVYMALNGLLFFLNKNRILTLLKFFILLGFLWFYTLLSGFSPSVLRAAMMMSLLILGRAMGRYTNSYNTLAGSAFVLLLCSPTLILNLGFQLSYLAVGGILFLHPKLYRQYKFEKYLVDKTWQLISVSISAQVFTFPLILFHFQQLPNYFILANLLVIPLASAILFLGIALIAMSHFAMLSSHIAFLMSLLLKCINKFVCFIEGLPYSISKGFNINFIELILLYACIICLIYFLIHRNNKYLFTGLILFLFILMFQSYLVIGSKNQKKIMIYSIPETTAIEFIDGSQSVILMDSSSIQNKTKRSFHIEPNQVHSLVKSVYEYKLVKNSVVFKNNHLIIKNGFVQFYDKTLFVADGAISISNGSGKNKIKVDYILVTHKYKGLITNLTKIVNADLIIIAPGFDSYFNDIKEKECRSLNQPFYLLNKDAFQKNL